MKEKSKILVVDDEVRNLRLMEALLIPLGYKVFLAHDGEEALKKVQEIINKHNPIIAPGHDY